MNQTGIEEFFNGKEIESTKKDSIIKKESKEIVQSDLNNLTKKIEDSIPDDDSDNNKTKLCLKAVKIDDDFNHKLFQIPNNISEKEIESLTQDFSEYIKATQYNISYYYQLLECFVKIRPKQSNIVHNLIEAILLSFSKTKEEGEMYINTNDLLSIICHPNEEHPKEDEETLTVFELLKDDNIDGFTSFLAENPLFDIKKDIHLKPGSYYYYIIDGKLNPDIKLIDFCSFFGSVQCFKYLFMNKCNITSYTCKWAIRGGSENIIKLLSQQNISFDWIFYDSVIYNQYKISEMLQENYRCELIGADTCLMHFNYYAFAYSINEIDYGSRKEYMEIIDSFFFFRMRI